MQSPRFRFSWPQWEACLAAERCQDSHGHLKVQHVDPDLSIILIELVECANLYEPVQQHAVSANRSPKPGHSVRHSVRNCKDRMPADAQDDVLVLGLESPVLPLRVCAAGTWPLTHTGWRTDHQVSSSPCMQQADDGCSAKSQKSAARLTCCSTSQAAHAQSDCRTQDLWAAFHLHPARCGGSGSQSGTPLRRMPVDDGIR